MLDSLVSKIPRRIRKQFRVYKTESWRGTQEAAERIQAKYDRNDYSRETIVVEAEGNQYNVIIGEVTKPNILENTRLKLSDEFDRVLGFRVDPPGEDTIGVFTTSTERTKQFIEADIVRNM